MTAIISKPDTDQKLDILSRDGQYDLACACGTKSPDEHRKQGKEGKWIYPSPFPTAAQACSSRRCSPTSATTIASTALSARTPMSAAAHLPQKKRLARSWII